MANTVQPNFCLKIRSDKDGLPVIYAVLVPSLKHDVHCEEAIPIGTMSKAVADKSKDCFDVWKKAMSDIMAIIVHDATGLTVLSTNESKPFTSN